MHQAKCVSTAICSAVLLAFQGCASNPDAISLSLSQMGTEEKVDAGSFWGDLNHRRSYNITGLGAIDAIGLVSVDPDPSTITIPKLTRDRLPDNLAMRLASECSMSVTTNFGTQATAGVVKNARISVAAVENLHAKQISQALQGTVQDLLKSAYLDQKAAQTAVNNLKGGLDSQNKDALEKLKAQKAYSKALENGFLGESAVDPDADSAKSELEILDAKERKLEKSRNTLTTEIASTQIELRDAKITLDNALSTPGLVISRWALAKKKVTSFEALDAARLRLQGDDEQTGYLVLGNPRVVTLMVGDDLMWRACKADGASCGEYSENHRRTGIDSAISPKKQYITSYQLLAQHWTWLEDRTAVRVREMSLSIDKLIENLATLAGTATTIARLGKIKADIQHTTSLALAASNSGMISEPTITVRPFSFATDADHEISVKSQIADQSGYGRIISMRTTMDSYVIKMKEKATLPTNSQNYCSLRLRMDSKPIVTLESQCNDIASEGNRASCKKEMAITKSKFAEWLQQ